MKNQKTTSAHKHRAHARVYRVREGGRSLRVVNVGCCASLPVLERALLPYEPSKPAVSSLLAKYSRSVLREVSK